MGDFSAQKKRLNYDNFSGVKDIQNVLSNIIAEDADQTPLFRLGIVNYELGSLMRMIIYRQVRPKSSKCGSKIDMRIDIGDAIVNLIALSDILGIDAADAMYEAVERIENTEYKRH